MAVRGVKFLDREYDNKKISEYIDSQGIELKSRSFYPFPSYHSYDSFLPKIETRKEDNEQITYYANKYCRRPKTLTDEECRNIR